MTARTKATLEANWAELDPYEQYVDTLDTLTNPQDSVTFAAGVTHSSTVQNNGAVTNASTLTQTGKATFNGTVDLNSGIETGGTQTINWVSKKGHDTKGDGTILRPYLTIETALGAVSATIPTVAVLPGTYQENLTWPTRTGIRLIGVGRRGGVVIDDASSGGTAVLAIHPATANASWEAYISDITIDHEGTGLLLNNASASGTWTFKAHGVEFVRDGGTSVIITKGGTGHPVLIEFNGDYADIGGLVYAQISDAEDRLRFAGMRLTGGLTTSGSGALSGTAEITFAGCEVKHEGVGGGSANQMLNSLFSWSRTGKTIALLDTNDLAGYHTENIIGS